MQKEKYKEILLATSNKSKKERAERLFDACDMDIKIYTPEDLGMEQIEVEEDGNSVAENAAKKARSYIGKTKFPIIGIDSALFIDDKMVDPLKPKRSALSGRDESEFTQEELAEKMVFFWKEVADRHGGEIEGYWHNAYVLVLPDGTEESSEAFRHLKLTNKVSGELDVRFPIRVLTKSRDTGKYVELQTPEEELVELKPIADAYKKLLLE